MNLFHRKMTESEAYAFYGLTDAEMHDLMQYNGHKDKYVFKPEYEAKMAEYQDRYNKARVSFHAYP